MKIALDIEEADIERLAEMFHGFPKRGKAMRMIYLVLITAMALLALLLAAVSPLRAQEQQQTLQGLPEYGVLLNGSPEVPVIINHSGRAIIGFELTTYTANGGKGPGAGLVLVYLRSAVIADGAQYQPGGFTDKKDPATLQIPAGAERPSVVAVSRLPIVKAVLHGVLFDDGEYVGSSNEFLEQATLRLNIYRDVGKQLTPVKYGSDAEIAAVWSKLEEMVPWRHDPSRRRDRGIDPDRGSAALNLLQERDSHGERLAFDLAEYYSSLPVPWRKK
jgi:hypothetical protein